MRLGSWLLAGSCFLVAATSFAAASTHIRRGPTAPHAARSRNASRNLSPRASAVRPGMTSERASEIQTALIKAGYLSGIPSGSWDSSSQAAMEKLQSDNGWQTKLVPDSRAIIKLGLGPKALASAPQAASVALRDSAPPVDSAAATSSDR